eukprot:scaffold212069_cov60-Attheya_sp.AAC.1
MIVSTKVSWCALALVALISSRESGVEAFAPTTARSFARSTTHLRMVKKVLIDGEAGTTGLQVHSRLADRTDLEIISPPNDLCKDEATRKQFINKADAVILCLSDAASIEAATWVEPDNNRTVLIAASTAFRVDDTWDYGFPVYIWRECR